MLCVDNLEPFANKLHRLVERPILEVITSKIVLVSHSPIRDRSLDFTRPRGSGVRHDTAEAHRLKAKLRRPGILRTLNLDRRFFV
jgi:hypothetical protein